MTQPINAHQGPEAVGATKLAPPSTPGMCQAYSELAERYCPRIARRRIRAGCVHEHFGEKNCCVFHTNTARTGHARCKRCAEADGHTCVMNVIAVAKIVWTRPRRFRWPA